MWLVVRHPDGRQFVNTRLARGAPLPTTRNVAGPVNWAAEDGPVRVSNLFRSGVTGRWQVVTQRQQAGRDGIPLEISAVRLPETMNALLRAQKLPATWIATLVDSRGTVISRIAEADRFVGKSGTPDLLKGLAQADEGVSESVTLDGRKALMAYSRAPETRWAVVVAMPRSELTAAARGALGWAGSVF